MLLFHAVFGLRSGPSRDWAPSTKLMPPFSVCGFQASTKGREIIEDHVRNLSARMISNDFNCRSLR